MKILIIILLSISLSGFGQSLPLDSVLFSEDGQYVLCFDYDLKRSDSLDVWNLYQKGSSIEKKTFQKIDTDWVLISDKNQLSENFIPISKSDKPIRVPVKIDEVIKEYKLTVKATEVSSKVNFSIRKTEPIEKHMPIKNSNKAYSYQVISIMVDVKLNGDTIETIIFDDFLINQFEEWKLLNSEILNHSRPWNIYSESGVLAGYSLEYAMIYKSDHGNYFTFMNLSTPEMESVSQEKESFKENIKESNPTIPIIEFISVLGAYHYVRLIKN